MASGEFEAMPSSEERYRRIVGTANKRLSIVGESTITFVSQLFADMLGYRIMRPDGSERSIRALRGVTCPERGSGYTAQTPAHSVNVFRIA